jgi:hypothetical protein
MKEVLYESGKGSEIQTYKKKQAKETRTNMEERDRKRSRTRRKSNGLILKIGARQTVWELG